MKEFLRRALAGSTVEILGTGLRIQGDGIFSSSPLIFIENRDGHRVMTWCVGQGTHEHDVHRGKLWKLIKRLADTPLLSRVPFPSEEPKGSYVAVIPEIQAPQGRQEREDWLRVRALAGPLARAWQELQREKVSPVPRPKPAERHWLLKKIIELPVNGRPTPCVVFSAHSQGLGRKSETRVYACPIRPRSEIAGAHLGIGDEFVRHVSSLRSAREELAIAVGPGERYRATFRSPGKGQPVIPGLNWPKTLGELPKDLCERLATALIRNRTVLHARACEAVAHTRHKAQPPEPHSAEEWRTLVKETSQALGVAQEVWALSEAGQDTRSPIGTPLPTSAARRGR